MNLIQWNGYEPKVHGNAHGCIRPSNRINFDASAMKTMIAVLLPRISHGRALKRGNQDEYQSSQDDESDRDPQDATHNPPREYRQVEEAPRRFHYGYLYEVENLDDVKIQREASHLLSRDCPHIPTETVGDEAFCIDYGGRDSNENSHEHSPVVRTESSSCAVELVDDQAEDHDQRCDTAEGNHLPCQSR